MKLSCKMIFIALVLLISACKEQGLGNMKVQDAFKESNMVLFVQAVLDEEYQQADKLLEQGLDINSIGTDSITPLLWVMGVDRDIDKIEYMLKKGANPNYVVPEREVSAMYFAAGGDSESILRLFLKYQGDPNLVGPRYESMLMVAIMQQRESYFDLLLDAGADVNWHNKFDHSAPWQALTPGRFDWAIYFVEKGYDANLQHLAAGAETVVASDDMQPYKEQLIDMLKTKGVIFPAGVRVKDYLETHTVTAQELQDLIYGRKLTLD